MGFFTNLTAVWREVSGSNESDDDYEYVIRKRDSTYWSIQKGRGCWIPEEKKQRALRITGADNAFTYVERNLWEYAEDVDVVIP